MNLNNLEFELKKLEVKDGDILILTTSEKLMPDTNFDLMKKLRTFFNKYPRDLLIINLPHGAEIETLSENDFKDIAIRLGYVKI